MRNELASTPRASARGGALHPYPAVISYQSANTTPAPSWEPCSACGGTGGKQVHVAWSISAVWYTCLTCWGMCGRLVP